MNFLRKIKNYLNKRFFPTEEVVDEKGVKGSAAKHFLSTDKVVSLGLTVACWRLIKEKKGYPASPDNVSKFIKLYLENERKLGLIKGFSKADSSKVELIVHASRIETVEQFRIEKGWTYQRCLIVEENIGYKD